MKVLQTVKFYHPSKGGMESVVKNIVDGVKALDPKYDFSIYANNHYPSLAKTSQKKTQITVIKERTPILFKSQPLNLRYASLKKLIIENEVIHHHYPFPNMEIALWRYRSLLKGKKLIVTWHANISNSRWSWIKRIYNPLIERLLSLSEVIVVTSPQLFENSDILKKYESKVRVIPLSFDPLFSLFQGKKLGTGSKKLLFVGKLRKYKGLKYLIEAIQPLDVTLTIVGDGEEEENLRLQVEAFGLQSKVFFLKNIDNQSLANIYSLSEIFILPSINEAEAFGVVQLEALANGLPVINTSLKSGVPYVSVDGETGFTVCPQSVSELREAITKLITNPDLYSEFSINAAKRARLFTREVMANSYLELYANEK
jgi:rhamnosyl/mannosyltransferase